MIETKSYKWEGFKIVKLLHDDAAIHVSYDIMEWLSSINIKGKNVVDGGSNIGLISMVFSKMIGKDGVVYAFEIQSTIQDLAISNCISNKKKNIIHYNKALSSQSGHKVGFTHIDYSGQNISSSGIKTESLLAGQPHCGEVETIALDDMNLDNVGLIKLDLEGHEPKALEGMWETIDKCKPYLLIELSPVYLENKEQETIDKILSHGYGVKELSDCNYVFYPI